MDSDEDEYSYDEDFAFGLSSINEEPSDLKSASCSSIDDFAKISSDRSKKAAVGSLDTNDNAGCELKCDDSQDSYSFDECSQDEQKVDKRNDNDSLSSTINVSDASETVPSGEDPDGSATITATLDVSEDNASEHCRPDIRSYNIQKQDCNDTNDSYSLDEDFDASQKEGSYIGEVVPAIDNLCQDEPSLLHADILNNDNSIEPQGFANSCTQDPKQNENEKIENDDTSSQTITTTTQSDMNHISVQNLHDDNNFSRQTEECKEDPKSKTKGDTRAGHLFCWEHKRQKPKKSAPLPRCATLTTKARSYLGKTQTEQQKPKHKYSKKRLQELAQPRKHHIFIYGGNENSHPNQSTIPKKKRVNDRHFLDRIEMMEKERREKLEHAAGEPGSLIIQSGYIHSMYLHYYRIPIDSTSGSRSKL